MYLDLGERSVEGEIKVESGPDATRSKRSLGRGWSPYASTAIRYRKGPARCGPYARGLGKVGTGAGQLITASASISTSISGEMSRLTSTMLVAGRAPPKNSLCARPTSSQFSISVT